MNAQLVLVNGFLGAGKTTLLTEAADLFKAQGVRVAMVTNDQGADLIDTLQASRHGIPVAEVSVGSFCCHLDALLAATDQLEQDVAPDVILAESVGYATDLNATVVLPLELMHPGRFSVAPLTVVVDARSLLHFALQDEADDFNDALAYLFARQIEEAGFVLLNKCELLAGTEQMFLLHWLQNSLPAMEVFPTSGKTGEGLASWVARLSPQPLKRMYYRPLLDLDYMRYGAAVTCLSWLNAEGTLAAPRRKWAQSWANKFLTVLVEALDGTSLSLLHLKLFLEGGTGQRIGEAVRVSASGSALTTFSWDAQSPSLPAAGARWRLNIRVVGSFRILEQLSLDALQRSYTGIQARMETCTCFRSPWPQPQYRYIAGEPANF